MSKTGSAMNQINHEIKHGTPRTKVVDGDEKLRTELQSSTKLEAKKIDDCQPMDICAKFPSVVGSCDKLKAEDFIDSVLNFDTAGVGKGKEEEGHGDDGEQPAATEYKSKNLQAKRTRLGREKSNIQALRAIVPNITKALAQKVSSSHHEKINIDNNVEEDESHQEEEDDNSSKEKDGDSEWQPEDEEEEDEEYDDEDLWEEELKTLFNTPYA